MTQKLFEEIRKVNRYHQEFWKARDLSKILEYSEFRHFKPVLEKAKMACINSGYDVGDHFEETLDMVLVGSGAERRVNDVLLSRYACYLVLQNADPAKEIVALGQTYFALQTRKQEVGEQCAQDGKRIHLRGEISEHNKKLAQTARKIGVENYGEFVDCGYVGLYGGLRAKDIHKNKKLQKNDKILDHMSMEELAANLFRATQTDAKLQRDVVRGQKNANMVHHDVGKKVRKIIKELGGTMPELLPMVENIKYTKQRFKNAKKLS